MGLWTVIVSAYIATCIMMIFRTWSISMYLIEIKEPNNLMIKHRRLAFFIYSFCMILLVPLTPQIAVSNKARKRFCVSYVKSVTKEET